MNIQEYKSLVASDGCIVCGRPTELHHPRFAAGLGQKAEDWLVIPLCEEHHRTGGHGVALHAGQRTFEGLYGTEEKLLAATIKRVVRRLDP